MTIDGGNVYYILVSLALAITKAYPCRNTRFDRSKAADIERDIQKNMLKDQLLLVGWYHSHPKFQAEPTLRDCDAQLDYQIKMRGASDATYTPCVSLIICKRLIHFIFQMHSNFYSIFFNSTLL